MQNSSQLKSVPDLSPEQIQQNKRLCRFLQKKANITKQLGFESSQTKSQEKQTQKENERKDQLQNQTLAESIKEQPLEDEDCMIKAMWEEQGPAIGDLEDISLYKFLSDCCAWKAVGDDSELAFTLKYGPALKCIQNTAPLTQTQFFMKMTESFVFPKKKINAYVEAIELIHKKKSDKNNKDCFMIRLKDSSGWSVWNLTLFLNFNFRTFVPAPNCVDYVLAIDSLLILNLYYYLHISEIYKHLDYILKILLAHRIC